MNLQATLYKASWGIYLRAEGKSWERVGMTLDQDYTLIRKVNDNQIFYVQTRFLTPENDHMHLKVYTDKREYSLRWIRSKSLVSVSNLKSEFKDRQFTSTDVSKYGIHTSSLVRACREGILERVEKIKNKDCSHFINVYKFR